MDETDYIILTREEIARLSRSEVIDLYEKLAEQIHATKAKGENVPSEACRTYSSLASIINYTNLQS